MKKGIILLLLVGANRFLFRQSQTFTDNAQDLSILKLKNTAWVCNQTTALEFWNGGLKNYPTSRIVSKMDGCGTQGEALIFETETAGETYPSAKMIIKNDGRIGVGTLSPFSGTGNYGLHISKGAHSSLVLGDPKAGHGGIVQISDGRQRVFIGANLYDDQNGAWSSFQTGKGSAGISLIADEGDWGTEITFITSQSDGHYNRSMKIIGNGNVGIGVNNPDSKLVVDGKIRSEEVKVEIINGPDYVFESDYELRTLKETKEYITANKHLPEIPSAKEMESDGIDLGDMNMRLLKKIEELTLYLIEQNGEIQELKKEVNILKNN